MQATSTEEHMFYACPFVSAPLCLPPFVSAADAGCPGKFHTAVGTDRQISRGSDIPQHKIVRVHQRDVGPNNIDCPHKVIRRTVNRHVISDGCDRRRPCDRQRAAVLCPWTDLARMVPAPSHCHRRP